MNKTSIEWTDYTSNLIRYRDPAGAGVAVVNGAKRFRKKPVVVTAMQWDGSRDSAYDIRDWIFDHGYEDVRLSKAGIHIPTPEGVMAASPGDWVIRGVKGEFYPCKPDVFAATYEDAT